MPCDAGAVRFERRRHRARRELIEGGFGEDRRALCARRFRWWRGLDAAQRERLEAVALTLEADVTWEAARGFAVTDEMKVTISAQAALLVVGLPDGMYRDVHTVIVHPTTLVLEGEHSQVDGIVSDDPMPVLGEAHDHGPVLLAWDEVLADARHAGDGRNVVVHEFAHKLDMLDGTVDGTPPLGSPERYGRWIAVCTAVYTEVVEGNGPEVLDPYAGVNPGEFFAVASEAFFDAPADLLRQQADLYEVLADFYGQDPAGRVTA